MVRRRLLEERHYGAAVKIQSQMRGYLQRVAYRRQLAEHRRNMILLTSGKYTDQFCRHGRGQKF